MGTKKADAKPAANENASSKQSAYILADALKAVFMHDGKGPSAFEALALALAGENLEFPIGEQIARVADSFESIAESLEVIADAMGEGE